MGVKQWLSDHIELDHKDLWGAKGDIKKFYDNGKLMWTDPKEAPPFMRKQPLSFMSLQDKDKNDFGTFVPELYELAKVNGLQAQQQRDEWIQKNPPTNNKDEAFHREQAFRQQDFYEVLYHVNHIDDKKNHQPKTLFELAVLDVIYNDNGSLRKAANAARKIEKRMTNEYLYRIKRNQALPPHVPKYQIESDYLKNLDKIGLEAVRPRDIDLNLPNPGSKVKRHDKWIHYLFQRVAFILTMLAAVSAASLAASIFWGLAVGLGVILAEWCAKEFGVFGTAESFLRHLSHFSEEFRWGNKISLKKTLKTAVLFAALGVATYGGVTLAWAGIMSLPWWSGASTLSTMVLTGMQYSLAAIVSGTTAVSIFLGGLDAVLFFWGFGIWHKQINFTQDDHLSMPNEEKRLDDHLSMPNEEKRLDDHLSMPNEEKRLDDHLSMPNEEKRLYDKIIKLQHKLGKNQEKWKNFHPMQELPTSFLWQKPKDYKPNKEKIGVEFNLDLNIPDPELEMQKNKIGNKG